MKCKNCGKETKGKNIYCTLKCRNIYVNKNLRDYSKNGEGIKNKSKEDYYKAPKYCEECGKVIPYERKFDSKYCSRKCSKKQINKNRKGTKYNISEEYLIILKKCENFKENRIRLEKLKKDYEDNPKKCASCKCDLKYSDRNKKFCTKKKCHEKIDYKNKSEYEKYKINCKFKFHLKDYSKEFNFNLITEYGWYKAKNNGDNMNGVSRDHKFSIREGFRQSINPLIISHPANCELILNRDNQSKCDKCSITIEELLEKIKIFEDKYGKYYDIEIETYIKLEK